MKVFLSYRFADEQFVKSTKYYLTTQSDLIVYVYGDELHRQNWVTEVSRALSNTDVFVLFLGPTLGKTQKLEALALANSLNEGVSSLDEERILIVKFPNFTMPPELGLFNAFHKLQVTSLDEKGAQLIAKELTISLGKRWSPAFDIPDEYIFEYEKDIIAAYSKDSMDPELIAKGCPLSWPSIERKPFTTESPLNEKDVGRFRDVDYSTEPNTFRTEESQILAGALNDLSNQITMRGLWFPEAGPRKRLSYPAPPADPLMTGDTSSAGDSLTIGILVSGGIAPGINAVIAGIVERQNLYREKGGYALTIIGYQNGLNAVYRRGQHWRRLTRTDVEGWADRGGSILGTSRLKEFSSVDPLNFASTDPLKRRDSLKRAVENVCAQNVDILYVIGGDGSMRAAHALWRTARELGENISIVGIPKTMDNDVLWMWQSFGFLSAVQRSRDLIQELHTEAESNPRVCVIQLFGSDSGFVVTHAVSAIGVCDLFLIPEVPFTMTKVCDYIFTRLKDQYKPDQRLESPHAMIVMAETAIPKDAERYFDDPDIGLSESEREYIRRFLEKGRVFGQTPDELRSGGLKLVSRVIQKYINERTSPDGYWKNFRVFTNEPRHQIRATTPSSSDTIIAKRLGTLAVDGAMAGYDDFMISQWLTEYVMVPLRLVVLGRKRIPRDGMFYQIGRASCRERV